MTKNNLNDWFNNIPKGQSINPETAVVKEGDVIKESLGGKSKTEVDSDTGKKDK